MTDTGVDWTPGRRATLQEVSLAVGVSTATVSRVLNQPDKVSPSLRARVQATIDALGYVPNAHARALMSSRSKTIGALVPSINNVTSAQTIESFQRMLDAHGYGLLLSSFEYNAETAFHRARALIERDVDALLLVSSQANEQLYDMLERRGVPFVTTWVPDVERPVPSVCFDHREATQMATEHLLDLGHREFALVTGTIGQTPRFAERIDAMRETLARRGLGLADDRIVIVERHDFGHTQAAVSTFLDCQESIPTAVVTTNDLFAAGVILECKRREFDVPGRISVVGRGDSDLAAFFSPPITTVRTPKVEIGEAAAHLLLDALGGRPYAQSRIFPSELVIRGSTAPARLGTPQR
jgi:LacI family transcriptional regulator